MRGVESWEEDALLSELVDMYGVMLVVHGLDVETMLSMGGDTDAEE